MEAAEKGEGGEADEATPAPSTDGPTGHVDTGVPLTGSPVPPAAGSTSPSPAPEQSATSLAHHSSFSPNATPSASASDLSKPHGPKRDPKGRVKPKLSPEQKAQLEALEKKQEEEKKAR